MKYSRNQINKAGDILLSAKDQEEYNRATDMINDWRSLHLPVLEELHNSLVSILKKEHIQIHSVSQRLKRLSSIKNKLVRNLDMKLGGLQDIGGLRIVFPTMDVLNRAYNILEKNIPENFELTKDPVNYILKPKDSGYRCIHFIYKYKSEKQELDGTKVELQIRTKLQHSWAMAVETAELVTETALKSSEGDVKWLDFFKFVSSLFALKEKTPILEEHVKSGYVTAKSLIFQIYNQDRDKHFVDTLRVLNITIRHSQNENHKNGYYILNINYERGIVKITAYSKDNEKKATHEYSVLEKQIERKNHAVVLVSVPKIQEIQNAYPSYFLDNKIFINIIDKEFKKNFRDLNDKTFKTFVSAIYPDSDNQYIKNEKEFFDLIKQYETKGAIK